VLISRQVVPEHCAVLGLPNEMIIPLNVDHRSMCRFASTIDQSYLLIESAISEIISGRLEVHSALQHGSLGRENPHALAGQDVIEFSRLSTRKSLSELWKTRKIMNARRQRSLVTPDADPTAPTTNSFAVSLFLVTRQLGRLTPP
jgi:hypothetical protein